MYGATGAEHSSSQQQSLEVPVVSSGDTAEPVKVSSEEEERPLEPRKARILGNSYRRCGCCITPKDGNMGFVVIALMVVPIIVFLSSVENPDCWWSFLVVLTLFVLSSLNIILSSSVDPGVLLPQAESRERTAVVSEMRPGKYWEQKVCRTCHIVRPPRSSHCNTCDWCVEDFDHHCGFLGSCVAKRTFRFFSGFFWCASPMALFIFSRCIYYLATQYDYDTIFDDDAGRWRFVATIGVLIYSAWGSCYLTGFAFMYGYFSCENTTQKEENRTHVDPVTGKRVKTRDVLGGGMSARQGCWFWICGPMGESRIGDDMV